MSEGCFEEGEVEVGEGLREEKMSDRVLLVRAGTAGLGGVDGGVEISSSRWAAMA